MSKVLIALITCGMMGGVMAAPKEDAKKESPTAADKKDTAAKEAKKDAKK